jgi:hypothetical protein
VNLDSRALGVQDARTMTTGLRTISHSISQLVVVISILPR